MVSICFAIVSRMVSRAVSNSSYTVSRNLVVIVAAEGRFLLNLLQFHLVHPRSMRVLRVIVFRFFCFHA